MTRQLRIWLQLFAEFMLSSGLGQALGMIAGLIYVRYMPVSDYAFYGLCLTSLTFISLTSDFGLTGSINYFWRKSLDEKSQFLDYLIEVRKLRLLLLLLSGVVVSLIVIAVFDTQKATWGTLFVALCLLLMTAFGTVTIAVNNQVLRLAGYLRQSYAVDIAGHVVRAVVALVMLAGVTTSALLGLFGGAAGALVAAGLGARLEKTAVPNYPQGKIVGRPRRDLLTYAIPVAPTVGLFALQDTSLLWMTAAYGGTEVVAEYYALGRIGAIIGMLSAFVIMVLVPRLSSIDDAASFNLSGWISRLIFALLGGLLFLLAWAIPEWFLWIIGDKYDHLQQELLLVVLFAAVTLLNTTSVLLNRARGWVKRDPWIAGTMLIVLLTLLYSTDYSASRNVLMTALLLSLSSATLNLLISVVGTFKPVLVKI